MRRMTRSLAKEVGIIEESGKLIESVQRKRKLEANQSAQLAKRFKPNFGNASNSIEQELLPNTPANKNDSCLNFKQLKATGASNAKEKVHICM